MSAGPEMWLRPGRAAEAAFIKADGSEVSGAELHRAALIAADLIVKSGAKRPALCCAGACAFTAALLGCLHAGREPLLLPERTADYVKQRLALFDLLITDSSLDVPCAQLAAGRFFTAEAAQSGSTLQLNPESRLYFFTSGSRGEPKLIAKRLILMARESELLAARLGPELSGSRVIASVYPQHLYGLTFRILLPLALGLPIYDELTAIPEELAALAESRLQERFTFISSPAFLRNLDLNLKAPHFAAVVSAGGAISAPCAERVRRYAGVPLFEIYGSTESGIIASRRRCAAGPCRFALFPGMKLIPQDSAAADKRAGSFDLSSPLVDEDRLELADVIKLHADGTLELLGRRDDIVKIDEKRVSLSAVKALLLSQAGVLDAETLCCRHGDRSCVGAVIAVSKVPAERTARLDLKNKLRQAVRAELGPKAVPRRIALVERIAENAMGKRQQSYLQELLS